MTAGKKVTPEKEAEIIKLINLGYSKRRIAEVFSLSMHTIGAIAKRNGLVAKPKSSYIYSD